MNNIPDRVRIEDLPGLTTEELTRLYTERRERADHAWSTLMSRATTLQFKERQCEQQTKLLLACYHELKQAGEHSELVEKLASHFEYHGIEIDEEQGE